MFGKAYQIRFELFFFSLLAILFGSLIVPEPFFQDFLMPLLLLINIASGVLLVSKKKPLVILFIILFTTGFLYFGLDILDRRRESDELGLPQLAIYALFYSFVTIEIIKQVWSAERVSKNVIIGLMTGYLSLGLLAFFIFMAIELTHPNSFEGLLMTNESLEQRIDSLMYYSYITMLTIGYGEIIPVTPLSQKAAILIGLMGQFYIVIITAVVVEKYVNHSKKS